jgi:hypothetical protein
LKLIATGSLPELDESNLPELPTYEPPLQLQFQPSESLVIGLSKLETFQKLLTPAIIDIIVKATNSYTVNVRLNQSEINNLDLYIKH